MIENRKKKIGINRLFPVVLFSILYFQFFIATLSAGSSPGSLMQPSWPESLRSEA